MVTNNNTYHGGCLCGDVRFTCAGQPISVSTCHCRTCQRASGADSVSWVEFPLSAVSWSGAKDTRYQSSTHVVRTFCSRCGSSLSYQIEKSSIDIVLACLDEPESFSPENEIWLDHRLTWNVRNKSIPGHRQFGSNS